MLNTIFDKFVQATPVSVISRGLIERMLSPQQLDEWFDSTVTDQYTRDLLFSTVFDIMTQVVLGSHKSVHSAYQASKEDIGVSITSLYNKLNGINVNTSADLVRFASRQAEQFIGLLGGGLPSMLPNYRIKLLDGNCIEKSERRIKELRDLAAGPLPGKSLVVYDPCIRLPIDVFPCEDGHAQERSILGKVLFSVEENDVWIADRNFCVRDFTCGIVSKNAHFIIREHKNYPSIPLDEEVFIGETETGDVYEQLVKVTDFSGKEFFFRRIRVSLKKETRDGDRNIYIICSMPKDKANTKLIAELYRNRWTIETAFQSLEKDLNSEINSLGYPKAALFGFCIALISYMVTSVIKVALGSIHGHETVEKEVSGYYLANEISGTYLGMMIAIPEEEWAVFRKMDITDFVELLKTLSGKVRMSAFQKHPRGPKKPPPKRKKSKSPHVSTAKLIANRKKVKS